VTRRPDPEHAGVRLERWGPQDAWLLDRLNGDSVMMEHLGGPEDAAKLAERHARYVALTDPRRGRMSKVVDAASGDVVGSVGYWEQTWQGTEVYEAGWSVLPEFQGRGYATRGTAAMLEEVRAVGRHAVVHAFPARDNAASNAVCAAVGFTLVGPCEVEFPVGHLLQANDWRVALAQG
jgi:RimJ/RimL family protein N-acetyltransferase